MAMPEEINRVLTDRLSNYLFCPTKTAMDNLKKEGYPFVVGNKKQQHLENIGDVMYDAMLFYKQKTLESVTLDNWQLTDGNYALCTIHRQENTDNPQRLESILNALNTISKSICKVVLPLHPRTKKQIDIFGYGSLLKEIKVLEPIAYFEMLRLQSSARMILTDSGGIQKEAFFHGVPCITMRDETEWVETLDGGWNKIVGQNTMAIVKAASFITIPKASSITSPYGKGSAAIDIVNVLCS
jgi:UDP-GlcNAc3NAcA epimerase